MKKIYFKSEKFTLVSDEDYERLNVHRWHLATRGYVARNDSTSGKRRYIYMHCEIMKAPKGQEIDHVNNIKHDNRRENLRFVTRRLNCANRSIHKNKIHSIFKGVSKGRGHWFAQISTRGKRKSKYCTTEIAAALQYDEWANKCFGVYAKTNADVFMAGKFFGGRTKKTTK